MCLSLEDDPLKGGRKCFTLDWFSTLYLYSIYVTGESYKCRATYLIYGCDIQSSRGVYSRHSYLWNECKEEQSRHACGLVSDWPVTLSPALVLPLHWFTGVFSCPCCMEGGFINDWIKWQQEGIYSDHRCPPLGAYILLSTLHVFTYFILTQLHKVDPSCSISRQKRSLENWVSLLVLIVKI